MISASKRYDYYKPSYLKGTAYYFKTVLNNDAIRNKRICLCSEVKCFLNWISVFKTRFQDGISFLATLLMKTTFLVK